MSYEVTAGPYGNCPVQAEGTIDGRIWYFRARGESWSFDVWPDGVGWLNDQHDLPADQEEWTYSEPYGPIDGGGREFAAGWMTEDEALGFIAIAAAKYLEYSGRGSVNEEAAR